MTAEAVRIRPLPTLALGALWGAVHTALLVVGFGLPFDILELISKSADDGCGCAFDPPFTTTITGLVSVLPMLLGPGAVLMALIALAAWLRVRGQGVTERRAAWFGATVSLALAITLFALAMTVNVIVEGWGALDWATLLGSSTTALLLAPLQALVAWAIVRVQRRPAAAIDHSQTES